MRDVIGIILCLLASFLCALAMMWANQSTAWWAGPIFAYGLILSVACGCFAAVLVICATSRRQRNG